jgi:uncharacterized protein (DUF302 family)
MLTLFTGTAFAQTADLFMLRTTSKSIDMVVEAIKSHSEKKKWQYLGASKVKNGEVTLVKICMPAVGQQVWPQGLHLSALLPCGNVAVYAKDGATQISVLHPRYMHLLHPTPEMEKASATALPLITEMLDALAK